MSRCRYCGADDHGSNQCPDMPPPVRADEATKMITDLQAQLASAQEELERWRRMASTVTPMLRAVIGEDEYARIIASTPPASENKKRAE